MPLSQLLHAMTHLMMPAEVFSLFCCCFVVCLCVCVMLPGSSGANRGQRANLQPQVCSGELICSYLSEMAQNPTRWFQKAGSPFSFPPLQAFVINLTHSFSY